MKVFIHIGYPKTATSWLQEEFFPKIENATIVPKRIIMDNLILPDALSFNPDEARNNILSLGETLLLSFEGLLGTTNSFGMKGFYTVEIAKRLYEVFPDAIIIMFIRKQEDLITSFFNQYIKGGGTWNIQKYIYHKNYINIHSLGMFSFEYFEYHKIIELYQKYFGRKKIQIYLFESFQENPKAIATVLAHKNSFRIDIDGLNYEKKNLAYRKYIRKIALLSNRFTKGKMTNKHYFFHIPKWKNISKKVLNKLNNYAIFGHIEGPKEILGKKILNSIQNYYKESNNIVENSLNLGMRKYNYSL